MSVYLLIKKHPLNKGCKEVHPKTYVEAIKDKLTDISLDEILASFNMLYLPYIGSREDTRLQVPKFLRRKGLWITYVDYDDKIRTEWYTSNHLGDEHWQSDIHWNVALSMSDLLELYFGSDAFYNTFVLAVTNAINNILDLIEVGVDEETVRLICNEIIAGLDLSQLIQSAINNYIQSDEFNNKLLEYFNNLDISGPINNAVNEYLNNTDLSENIDNSVTKYLDGKDLSTLINNAVSEIVNNINWGDYIDTSQLLELIDLSVNNYLSNNEDIANLVKNAVAEYLLNVDISSIILGIDFSEDIQLAVNNWFTNNTDTLVELMTPIIEGEIAKLREELTQWCNDIERVVANALIRHEQWIQEHSES